MTNIGYFPLNAPGLFCYRAPLKPTIEKKVMSSKFPIKVLIADQASQDREFCQDALYGLGMQIFEANNGRKAWAIIEAEEPQILIVRDSLPEIDGLTLCQWVKSHSDQEFVQVIVMLEEFNRENRVAAFESGAQFVTAKPLSAKEVRTLAESCQKSAQLHIGSEKCGTTEEFLYAFLESATGFRPFSSRQITQFTLDLSSQLKLSTEEFEILQLSASLFVAQHLLKSHIDRDAILGQFRLGSYVSECLTHMSENWDGSGEPFGLSGEDIPLVSRILRISVDMTLGEKGEFEMRKLAGISYDPQVVQEFLNLNSGLSSFAA